MKRLKIIVILLLFCGNAFGQIKPMPGTLINWVNPNTGNIIGFWPFWENGGTVVSDLSGNGNTGIFFSEASPIWTVGKGGSALAFTDDYINLPSTGSLKRSSQSGLTVVYAIDVTSIGNYDCVISAGKYDTSWAMLYLGATTSPRGYAFNRAVTCPVDFGTGYYVLAFTANAARFDWYKNGIWVGESVGAGTWEMDEVVARIGDSDGYGLTNSVLHWVSVYDRVLSASEIAQFQDPSVLFKTNQTSLWQSALGNGITVPLIMHSYRMRRAD